MKIKNNGSQNDEIRWRYLTMGQSLRQVYEQMSQAKCGFGAFRNYIRKYCPDIVEIKKENRCANQR